MLSKFWYKDYFFVARIVVYVISLFLIFVMLFADPFHYACGANGFICPGCGVKTGLLALLHGDLTGAYQSNPFSLFMASLVVFSIFDFIAGCFVYKLRLKS